MIRTTNSLQKLTMTLGATFVMGAGVLPLANAQSMLHRHHRAAGALAGYAAYRAARHTGNNRMASGRHRNFMQRHPYVTGAGAAVLANHYAKRHH